MSHALTRLDEAARVSRPASRSATASAERRYAITDAGEAALAAAGRSCDRIPWPSPPCLLNAGHNGDCNPRAKRR